MARLTLRDYQEIGVAHLRGNPRAALMLDMGLGKTAIVLEALAPEHLPALVIAPKRVAERVWPAEAPVWRPDLEMHVAAGTPRRRGVALGYAERTADVVVIGRENIRDVLTRWPKNDHPFKTVVLDELSSYKNRATVRWKAARKLVGPKTGVTHVWGLTGTPAPNGLHDLYAQIGLLDDGQRLGRTVGAFRDRWFRPGYTLPNGTVTEWIPTPTAPDEILEAISDICLAMESDGRVELPPVLFNTVEVPLEPRVRQVYSRLKRDLVVELDDYGFPAGQHTAATAAALSNRLQQVTAGFLYADGGDAYRALHTGKATAAREIVEGSGGGVLVLYRYLPERDMLMDCLRDFNPKLVTDPTALDEWDAGALRVLVAHPASIGHGLNLQHGGHTIVWSTTTWSQEEWAQVNKRLQRSGQKHPVVIHTLEVPGTIDQAVAKALRRKESVQQTVLEYLESPV